MPPVRRHPRVTFSGRTAPRLETDQRSYEILDLSPTGLRFRMSGAVALTLGELLRATIRFHPDRAIEVAGRVLRVSAAEAALQLDGGYRQLAARLPMGPASPRRTGLLW